MAKSYPHVDKLEAEWTRAYKRLDQARAYEDDDEEYFEREEETARDALDDAKEELNMCGVVGCHNVTPEHALCDEHRTQ